MTDTADASTERPSPDDHTGSQAPAPERAQWALLRETLQPQRRALIVATAVGLAWTLGKIASPTLVRFGIDRGIGEDDRLWMWAGLIGAAGVFAGVLTSFRRYLAFREARWTETRLREQIFTHLMSLHVGYHDRAQTGQLMSRSSSDLNQIQMFVVMLPITLANFALVLGVVVILFVSDWQLAIVALASLPMIQYVGGRFSRTIHPAIQQVQAEQAELATVVEESVGGVRVIKGFGAEAVQSARLRTEADDIRRVSIQAARIRAKFLPMVELLPQIGLLGVLWFGGNRVIDGDLTLGQLVAFNVYVALLVWPLRMLGMTLAWAQRARVALDRINEILTVPSEVMSPASPKPLPARREGVSSGEVHFESVRFAYDAIDPAAVVGPNGVPVRVAGRTVERVPVLDGFELRIGAGESVAIVGETGSGKSTIARLLIRFYDVDDGAIEIDGVDVRALALADLRRAVGIVFEDTLLFHDTVRSNIAFADPTASDADVERAARLAGAHDFVMGLPDAYDTVLGERGFSLSGGQRQRIAIARAIVSDPRVLVLDDATSAVDPSKEHEIRAAMATVMEGRSTIVIAHRPGTIALADRVVLLAGGQVRAAGAHEDLLATTPEYREVLAAMSAEAEGDGPRGGEPETGLRGRGTPAGGV